MKRQGRRQTGGRRNACSLHTGISERAEWGCGGQPVRGQHPPTKTKQRRWGAIYDMLHSLKQRKQNTSTNISLLGLGAQTWSCLKDGEFLPIAVLYQLALAVSFYWARPSGKRAEYGPWDSSFWWADTFKRETEVWTETSIQDFKPPEPCDNEFPTP